jgi:hypothetical protein
MGTSAMSLRCARGTGMTVGWDDPAAGDKREGLVQAAGDACPAGWPARGSARRDEYVEERFGH